MTTATSTPFPEKDPYQVLRISSTSSNAEIATAYRKLARELHPDKHASRGDLTPTEIQAMKLQFHEIQAARSFLLDAEHFAARQNYDAKLASDLNRAKTEGIRQKAMSERRRRMKNQLSQQEKQAAALVRELHTNNQSSANYYDDVRDRLSKEGSKLQQDYSDVLASAELENEIKVQEGAQRKVQDCQVRLKWSRKKIKYSPSEHSIADRLSAFGQIVAVEFLGSKGNAALVTFKDPSSCFKVVDFYADSNEMRAAFVTPIYQRIYTNDIEHRRDTRLSSETVADWKSRRSIERERALRQMEDEFDDQQIGTENGFAEKMKLRRRTKPFPPDRFFNNRSSIYSSPLEWLENKEESCLGRFLSQELIRDMKILK